jgi:hypothetical protein
MSTGVPKPDPEKLPAHSQVVRSNRRQMLLFAALTLLLSVATVWGVRVWPRNSDKVIFAVGNSDGVEARLPPSLPPCVKNTNSKLRLKIVPYVRDRIGMRRNHLKRHAGRDDNVVVVKTAQSA